MTLPQRTQKCYYTTTSSIIPIEPNNEKYYITFGIHPEYHNLLHTIKDSYVEAGDDQNARLRVDLDEEGRFVQLEIPLHLISSLTPPKIHFYNQSELCLIWNDVNSKTLFLVHPDLGFTKVDNKIARIEIYNVDKRLPAAAI